MVTLFSATVTGLKLCPPSGCSEGRKRRADDQMKVFADVSVSSECDPDEKDECSNKTKNMGAEIEKICGEDKCTIRSSEYEESEGEKDDSSAKSLATSVLLILAAYIFA